MTTPSSPARLTVTIPAQTDHAGEASVMVSLPWVCSLCGGPRGEPYPALSYDGSLRMSVSAWNNPCGHIERYSAVRAWMLANPEQCDVLAPAHLREAWKQHREAAARAAAQPEPITNTTEPEEPEMATTRPYLITNRATGALRLVRAATPAQALRHVAIDTYDVTAASASAVLDAMEAGVKPETAGADSDADDPQGGAGTEGNSAGSQA